MTDMEKSRREALRWMILSSLNFARPAGAGERVILGAVKDEIRDLTRLELRREMDYLLGRGLLDLENPHTPHWHARLTRHGVDVVEHTVEVEPGIARPPKYW
ncbi:MAG: hypothetical protein OEY50_06210 [Nitrospinota bacterium]|nr:hypothetical protein [Nitrospinota bacterium]MDH5678743.1 hypothetical protein [Nitrospinota bacterium]MDH5757644.1 hypothetical protein [Nitrospinota bacterium]